MDQPLHVERRQLDHGVLAGERAPDAALELVSEFRDGPPTIVIVKHANPCGVASADTLLEAYRAAFDNFNPGVVACYDSQKISELLGNTGIVRNRLKIESTISNARMFLRIQETHGSFDNYLWRFVDGKPLQNAWSDLKLLPASTPLSDTISRDLKRHGFRFVGSTIIYSLMQAVGMVNDHLVSCHRHAACQKLGR